MKWEILGKKEANNVDDIVNSLLENRGIKTKKEIDQFINPKKPSDIDIQELGIKKSEVKSVLERLSLAKQKKQKIVIFGDYDCDGVCATAILWETMFKLGYDVMPYIPDRFDEGYGLKRESFEKLKLKGLNPNLVITVDNGVVAYDGVNEAKKLGIDVLVIDHHTKGEKKLNTKYLIHSTQVCGSALSWFVSKELGSVEGLDLVAIGTIADQMPLLNINRSLVKFGLESLKKTNRKGLKALISNAGIKNIGVYEIGFIIAPRINAMGRLSHALDSLRLVCTRDTKKAEELAKVLNETNIERQKIVEDVLIQAEKLITQEKIVIIEGNYHEGVIGLASGKITEKLYRPSIVISKGENISKASARSVQGFNIIEAIKETGLILEGGGHPMAAGFSIETKKIEEFKLKINALSTKKLIDEILEKKLKIDLELNFENITDGLVKSLQKFEPVGYGNFPPVFMSKKVKIIESKLVGSDGKHLKLKVKQDEKILDAIYFGGVVNHEGSLTNKTVDLAYYIEENIWNERSSIQLKVKDLHLSD